jgi:hypothetical protein
MSGAGGRELASSYSCGESRNPLKRNRSRFPLLPLTESFALEPAHAQVGAESARALHAKLFWKTASCGMGTTTDQENSGGSDIPLVRS